MTTAYKDEAIGFYNELLEREHLESTVEGLAGATEREGLAFGTRPVCSVLRPFFIDRTTYNFVRQSSTLVMLGVAALGERLLSDEALRREMSLSPEEEEIIKIGSGYGPPDVSARLDGFLSARGEFNFVEYNAESPGGLAYGDALGRAFAAMPIMEAFKARYDIALVTVRPMVFDRLTSAYHRWGGKGLPSIAIVDWRGVSTYNEFLLMQTEFESHGCRVKIADPDELEYSGGRLRAGDFAIDIVYKRVVITEFLSRYGLNHPLIEALRDRAVCMANGFGVQVLYKKSLFALLSDPAYGLEFEPGVASAIARHIPWTRKVREGETTYAGEAVELLRFTEENREKLVLKPSSEYGGKGVTLGWECDSAAWRDAIETALSGDYIVQKRVPVASEIYPAITDGGLSFDERYFDLDPYVWDGDHIEGCGVRLSKAALLNVTAGGGSATPMFII